MKWQTRVTDLLGCRYPILQGAMAGLGKWDFAAAVANAGGFGMITASSSRTPEGLREDIRKCREITDGAFGVNLSFGMCPRIDEMLEICIEEKVPVETAVYNPVSLAPRIKESGITWIHKSARVKDAVSAERLGADAVIVVGLEGFGFKNPEQLPTMTSTIWGVRQVNVPFIAAGGIANAQGFLGALGMGADGIMMGTAFMATKECRLSQEAKELIVRASPENSQLRHRTLAPPDPQAYAEVMRLRDEVPMDRWLKMVERVNLKEPNWKDLFDYEDQNNLEKAPVHYASLAVGGIDRIYSIKELIDNIISEAEKMLERFGRN